MEYMEMLKGKICKEIDKQAEKGGELTKDSLEIIYKLSDTYKNLLKIEMLEENAENGYSEDGGWVARGIYGRGNSYDSGMNYPHDSYDGGMSYARRGGGNRRGTHYVRAHYSRDGYSQHDSDDMIGNLHEMMQNASSEKEREAFRKFISQIENM